jgi:hypothetical protein
MPWTLIRRHSVEPGRAWRSVDQRERRRGPRVRGRQTSEVSVGISLREALAMAARLGFEVRHRRRHGELFVGHPVWASPALVVNSRRKDVTRQLVRVLRRATDALAAREA